MISVGTTKHTYTQAEGGTTRNWPFTFPINTTDGSDIALYKTVDDVVTEITANYNVDVAGAYVTYPTVVSGLPLLQPGEKITLVRIEPLEQQTDYQNGGNFNAETVEAALDKLTMIAQQFAEELARAVKYPIDITEAGTIDDLVSTLTALALEAENYANALKGTSTTSITIGTGAKTFTTQPLKQFAAGQWILIFDDADSANYMFGQITSYTDTTLVVDVQKTGGSGTLADWNIYISGIQGIKGDPGDTAVGAGADASKPASPEVNDVYYATDTFKLYICKSAGVWTDATAEFAGFVRTTGDQTVAGIKTFSSIPVGPASDPTTDNQLSRKKYVDDGLALKEDVANKDTDGTLAANSDTKYASQKAVKTYVDARAGGYQNVEVFTASGTWEKPAGVSKVFVEVVGGGGASGSASGEGYPNYGLSASGGGGGGGYASEICTVTEDVTVTIGAGGTASGGTGGTSSFGSFCSAAGGVGGSSSSGTNGVGSGGAGGVGSGGDINIKGSGGGCGIIGDSHSDGHYRGGLGGSSHYGGGSASTGTATAGGNYGGGASGAVSGPSSTPVAGAAGAAGVVIVWW